MIDKKKILVLTSTFPRWKGDREPPFVFELSRRMSEKFDIVVLCPHASEAKTLESLEGLEVHRFRYFISCWQTLAYNGGILANLKKNRFNYFLVPFFLLAELLSLVAILRKVRVDAIHAHWLIPQGLIALVACAVTCKRIPVVCTSHGGDLFGLSGKLMTRVKTGIVRRVDRLTVVSHAMRSFVNAMAARRDVAVISMGVDLVERFTPSPETMRTAHEILFVGRLVEKKGVRYLILAMPEILAENPQAELVIAGDGPERGALEKLSAELGIGPRVKFIGPCDNAALPEFYRRAAVFVAPSIVDRGGDQEGLGLVLVEALGCECPVIATDLPAIRDVVTDGITGLICRQKDSIDIAKCVNMLLADTELGRSLGHAGRCHVMKHFEWCIVADRYGQLFDDVIGSHG